MVNVHAPCILSADDLAIFLEGILREALHFGSVEPKAWLGCRDTVTACFALIALVAWQY